MWRWKTYGDPQDPDIVQRVNHYYNENAYDHNVSTISPHDINVLIDKLRSNASPGVDGITAEHIKNGKCTILSQLFSSLYSFIISFTCIPSSFCNGIIVPILKKPTLNPIQTENYRPITISTTFSKLLELMLIH